MNAQGALYDWWTLDFAAPFGTPLSVGRYEGATRFPFQSASQPGLDVSGEGRGCNTLLGLFDVKQVAYTPGGGIDSFWATFEQHCEGQLPALTGEIRYNADVPLLMRAPAQIVATAGEPLEFTATAFVLQGRVTVSASGLPASARFIDNHDNTGTFQWTPAVSQVGRYVVTFVGDDGHGTTDSTTTKIVVVAANDAIENATVIASLPFTETVPAVVATREADDPPCVVGETTWYAYTPSQAVDLDVSSAGSGSNGYLGVYTGSPGALTAVACTAWRILTGADFRQTASTGATWSYWPMPGVVVPAT